MRIQIHKNARKNKLSYAYGWCKKIIKIKTNLKPLCKQSLAKIEFKYTIKPKKKKTLEKQTPKNKKFLRIFWVFLKSNTVWLMIMNLHELIFNISKFFKSLNKYSYILKDIHILTFHICKVSHKENVPRSPYKWMP